MAQLDLSSLRQSIHDSGFQNIKDIRVLKERTKKYSQIWLLEIYDGKERGQYILKFLRGDSKFQIELAKEAREIFKESKKFFVPKIFYLEKEHMILSEFFPGKTLKLMSNVELGANPWKSCSELKDALRATGRWIRQYHAATRHSVCDDISLTRYVENRSETLEILPATTADKLLEAVKLPISGDFSIVHSDFTPSNVLVDQGTICVIDFGIWEWREMSPWWDVVSMIVGLRRHILFSWRSPARWWPRLLTSLEAAFLESYGGLEVGCRMHMLCLATRHFAFLEHYAKPGSMPASDVFRDKRMRWHLSQLEHALAEL